jgi:hypothetical protein
MGESKLKRAKREGMLMSCAGVETAGGRVQVRWESDSAATPMGQLAYFVEFLTLTGLWSRWQESCPLNYVSPNAPTKAEVLGTWMLSVLPDTNGIRTSPPFVAMASIRDCWACAGSSPGTPCCHPRLGRSIGINNPPLLAFDPKCGLKGVGHPIDRLNDMQPIVGLMNST